MPRKKRTLIVSSIGLIALIMFLGLFINNRYFFNPVFYKKDNITYLPWTWYKNPMSIEYNSMDLNSTNGWKTIKIKNKQEIKVVFDELKKSQQISEYDDKNSRFLNEIIIRSSDDSVDLDIFVGADGKSAQVKSTNTFVKLTNKLTELVNKRMKETK